MIDEDTQTCSLASTHTDDSTTAKREDGLSEQSQEPGERRDWESRKKIFMTLLLSQQSALGVSQPARRNPPERP